MLEHADAFMRRGRARPLLRKLFHGMREHHGARVASAMAFEVGLASLPMLALAGWLSAKILKDTDRSHSTLSALLDLTPEQVHALVDGQLVRFSGITVAPVAILGTLWLASGAFHTLMSVFETALRARHRPWWKKRLIALACVLVAFASFAVSGWLTVVLAGGPSAVVDLLGGAPERTTRGTPWVALGVGGATTTTLIAAFFRISLQRPGVQRRAWPGALLTVTIAAAASWGFTLYARTLGRYTLFYGSLAAAAVLLIWLWICCAALLLGAELNAQLEGVERGTIPDLDDG